MKNISVKVLWKKHPKAGSINVINGKLSKLSICLGNGKCEDRNFTFKESKKSGIQLEFSDTMVEYGPEPTLVKLSAEEKSFSFFLRDALFIKNPIYISEFEVVVTLASDERFYDEIVRDINSDNKLSDFQRFDIEEEESWEASSKRNRKQYCPTWLGISRDMRIFRVGYADNYGYWGEIIPYYHSFPREVNEKIGQAKRLTFAIGQGTSCRVNITRSLDYGYLPILHSLQKEDSMEYNLTMFATLENSTLSSELSIGTDYRVCYAHSGGNMFSDEDKKAISDLIKSETIENKDEVILRCRIEAINTGKTPSYAWLKVPELRNNNNFWFPGDDFVNQLDSKQGFSLGENGKVVAITLIDGKSASATEMAILLQPKQSIIIDLLIPHQPISLNRAKKLREQDYFEHFNAARKYWIEKLNKGGTVSIPEKRINELLKAGLLHCDLATIGKDPYDALATTIGAYAPIGTESSPIIQFFDSMGWHDVAERSIDFFLKRQLKSGFIQNFNGYESETGPLLWTMGEHYRYTRDKKWLKRVKPHIDKASTYLLDWRNKNKKEEFRKTGSYGLVDGKIADPDDFYHQFFLNAGTYVGLKRCLEMYEELGDYRVKELRCELKKYKEDLLIAFYTAMANAPLIPTPDGTWVPFIPPWTDDIGATALYQRKGTWFSHGSFTIKDSVVGGLYLVFHELIDVNDIGCSFMLKSNQSPITVENAALSQPYYSRHDFAHLKRGEIKSFLKTYYNQLTGLVDQQTYTFWEHYFHASQHKTHEEAWFLMQTRWMLYLEEGNMLKLFSGIPRKWLESSKTIELNNLVSYFGKINASVECSKNGMQIVCKIEIKGKYKPKMLSVRLPHFKKLKPKNINIGEYDIKTEICIIKNFTGNIEIRLDF